MSLYAIIKSLSSDLSKLTQGPRFESPNASDVTKDHHMVATTGPLMGDSGDAMLLGEERNEGLDSVAYEISHSADNGDGWFL